MIGLLLPDTTSTTDLILPVAPVLYSIDPVADIFPQPLPPPPATVQEIVQQSKPVSNVTQVEGIMYDAVTKKVIPASIQLIVTATGLPFNNDQPELLQDGYYTAWTDQDPTDISVKFTAPGYDSELITIAILTGSPDIYLQPAGTSSKLSLLIGAGLLLLLLSKKKAGSKVGAFEFNIGTLITVGAAFLLFKGIGLTNSLFSTLGLGPDPTAADQANPGSPWKPEYWQQYSSFPHGAIDETTATDIAGKIYNALGIFSDDYSTVLNAMSQLKSKAQVSFVAWEFQKMFNMDLLSFLSQGGNDLQMPWDGLSSTHLQTLITFVNNLPAN